jgi:hemolysin III
MRPAFKGIFHLLAASAYISMFPYLNTLIPSDLKVPFNIYLISIIGNFVCSTLLHLVNWNDNTNLLLRKLDHVMIYIAIASTYIAAISTFMYDISGLVVCFVWIGTIFGIISRLFYTDAPKIFISGPYFIIGWSILLDPYIILKIIERVPEGAFFALLGGSFYSLGGIIYTKEKPKLWPKYMSFHELFHICTIIGTTMFVICLFKYGIPYHIDK